MTASLVLLMKMELGPDLLVYLLERFKMDL